MQQSHEGQDAALAPVVGTHHEGDVLDADDEQDGPDDQRDDADDVVAAGYGGVVIDREDGLHGVEG